MRYHVAFYMPTGSDRMAVADALDFPGVFSQGFDLPDARAMIGSAMEDMAQSYLEEGQPLATPDPEASDPEADFIELIPLSVTAGPLQPSLARK